VWSGGCYGRGAPPLCPLALALALALADVDGETYVLTNIELWEHSVAVSVACVPNVDTVRREQQAQAALERWARQRQSGSGTPFPRPEHDRAGPRSQRRGRVPAFDPSAPIAVDSAEVLHVVAAEEDWWIAVAGCGCTMRSIDVWASSGHDGEARPAWITRTTS